MFGIKIMKKPMDLSATNFSLNPMAFFEQFRLLVRKLPETGAAVVMTDLSDWCFKCQAPSLWRRLMMTGFFRKWKTDRSSCRMIEAGLKLNFSTSRDSFFLLLNRVVVVCVNPGLLWQSRSRSPVQIYNLFTILPLLLIIVLEACVHEPVLSRILEPGIPPLVVAVANSGKLYGVITAVICTTYLQADSSLKVGLSRLFDQGPYGWPPN